MDDDTILRAIQDWHLKGDERQLADCLGWLERWLPTPPGIARALGKSEVEGIRFEVLERLLLGKPPPLLSARQPRAFARAAFRNRLWDALRQRQRGADAREAETAPSPGKELDAHLDEARWFQWALEALHGLRPEERAAVLLLHAPDRLAEEEWEALARQHPPPPPSRPTSDLDRSEIARLLFPLEPEPVAYERTNKLIQRAYPKLRRALALHTTLLEDT